MATELAPIAFADYERMTEREIPVVAPERLPSD
jgi:hypothetical protein